MKKTFVAIGAALLLSGAIVYAQAPGWRQGMGPGMLQGYYGSYDTPGFGAGEAITLDQAKDIAKQDGEKYLKGFTVERVVSFTGMRHSMYSVEMKGPKGEVRYLHINPWGGVMPFAGASLAGQ